MNSGKSVYFCTQAIDIERGDVIECVFWNFILNSKYQLLAT